MCILIVVDMQKGFIGHDTALINLEQRILQLMQSGRFNAVIATRFSNRPGSMYERLIDWNGMETPVEQELADGYADCIDAVIDKDATYACVDCSFVETLRRLNGGVVPNEVYIVGIDTDACVLMTAVGLFERGIRPIVISDCCWSTLGENAHRAGIVCMQDMLGQRQVISLHDILLKCGVNRQFYQKLNPQEPTGLARWSVSVSDKHGVLRTLSASEVTHEITPDANDDDTTGNVCGYCQHFMGFGDFELCCAIQARRLAYADTPACNRFEPKTPNE